MTEELKVKITADVKQAIAETDKFKSSLNKIGTTIESGVNKPLSKVKGLIASAFTVGAITAAVTSIKRFTSEIFTLGDEVDKTSQKLNMSAEQFQLWRSAANDCGISASSFEGAIKQLNLSQTHAIKGTQAQIEAFEALGISQSELAAMDGDKLFSTTIQQLQMISDNTQRAAIASDLFSESYSELAPLLNQTAGATQQSIQLYQMLGGTMSNDLVANSAALSDALAHLSYAWQGLKNVIGAAVIPVIKNAVEWITAAIVAVNQLTSSLFGGKGGGTSSSKGNNQLSNISSGIDNIGVSASGASGSVEKLKRSLMGIDELNVLTDNSSSGGGGGGGGGSGIDTNESIFSSLNNDIESGIDSLGEKVEKIKSKIEPLITWIKDNFNTIKTVVIAIGGALLTWKVTNKLANFINTITSLAGSGAIKAIGSALGGAVEGPVLAAVAAVVIAIVNLVAAFKHLWETNEEFRNAMTDIWEDIVSKVQEFCQGIVDRINALGFDFQNIVEVLKAVWDGYCKMLAPVFKAAFMVVSKVLGTVLDVATGQLDVFIGLFTGNWSQLWTGVKEIFSGIWNGIAGIFSAKMEMIRGIADTVLRWFGTSWNEVWTNVSTFFKNIWNGIVSFFTGIWETIKNTVSTVINAVSNVISTVMNSISSVISTVWNGIKTTISTVVDGIKTKVSSVFESVKSSVSSVFDSIKSTATSVWNGIKTAITTPIEEAKNTIRSAIDSIKGFFANCHLSFPHIKLPHFSITGSFSLAPPRVPNLSISWYKEGGILTGPTIFGMNGSNLMAGGEAGAEAVLPLSAFYKELENILVNRLNNDNVEKYLSTIAENSGNGQSNITVNIDGEKLFNIVVDKNNQKVRNTGYSPLLV